MVEIRKHERVDNDEAESEAPSVKRTHRSTPTPPPHILNGQSDAPVKDLSRDNRLSSPVSHVAGIFEGSYFPDTFGIPDFIEQVPSSPARSDSSFTMVESSAGMDPHEAENLLKSQYHFYNDKDALKRGKVVLSSAEEIIGRPRGSPTAKSKVSQLQDIAVEFPRLGEDLFSDKFGTALLNEGRMVPKESIAPSDAVSIDQFKQDPKAWQDDFLGFLTRSPFRAKAVPQPEASKGSFAEIFKQWPRIVNPKPDLIYGISDTLLKDERYYAIFNTAPVKPILDRFRHPFAAIEFKTKTRPSGEAQVQCQRTGSAMVNYLANWNDYANYRDVSQPIESLPKVDYDNDTSEPDTESFIFTCAVMPDSCKLFVNWREVWSNGAVYWHTTPLKNYSLEYGIGDEDTERFQQHISNIIDWGLCERAEKIYKQAQALAKRKGSREDLPPPEPQKWPR